MIRSHSNYFLQHLLYFHRCFSIFSRFSHQYVANILGNKALKAVMDISLWRPRAFVSLFCFESGVRFSPPPPPPPVRLGNSKSLVIRCQRFFSRIPKFKVLLDPFNLKKYFILDTLLWTVWFCRNREVQSASLLGII